MKADKLTAKIIAMLLSLIMVFQICEIGVCSVAQNNGMATDEQRIKTYYDGQSLIREENVTLREESVKHFKLENGANIAVVYPEPVHFQTPNGNWEEIDNGLILNENILDKNGNPVYSLKASGLDLRLPQSLENGNKIHIAKDQIPFEMGLVDSNGIKGENAVVSILENEPADDENASSIERTNAKTIQSKATSSKVKYASVFDNGDLEYTISSSKIKEDIVITEKQESYEYQFDLNYGNLIPVTQTDGSIGFFKTEKDEEAVYSVSAPYMFDANGEYSDDVQMTLDGHILTVTADAGWINKHTFPVKIDPTVNITSGSFQDSHVRYLQKNSNYGSEDTLYAGNGTLSLRRTYVKFTLPAMPDNAVIQNATFRLYQKSCSYSFSNDCKQLCLFDLTGKPSWTESGITWNNQPLSTTKNGPQTDGTSVIASVNGDSTGSHTYKFDLTNKIKDWYNNNNNNGFMVSTNNENKNCQPSFYSSEASSNKPYVTIQYTNNIGLEDYWHYQTVDMGRSGSVYINSHNGSYYYVHEDASTSGLVMPVSVSHIYGSPDKYASGAYGNMKFGKGFKLNLIETITSSSYTDADGTEHAIVWSDNAYRIEDDPTTIRTTVGGQYKLTYLNGSEKTFSNGFLTETKDQNGNRTQIVYTNSRIVQVKSGVDQVITFTYSSTNYLTSITDPGGRVTTFAYDTNGYLTSIQHPDSQLTSLSYSSGDLYEIKNSANAKWRFTLTSMHHLSNAYSRVASVTAYGENNSSAYIDKLDFIYSGSTTEISNNHGDAVMLEFDKVGRNIAYTSKGNIAKIGYNTSGNLNNTVADKSNPFAAKENLIPKSKQSVANWSGSSSLNTQAVSSERLHHYPSARKVTGQNASGALEPFASGEVKVTPGKTYTATVDINIVDTFATGKILLRVSSGAVTVDSPAIVTTGNEWMPLYASITVPQGQTSLYLQIICEEMNGTFYADAAQVTEGSTVSYFNLIPDSSFSFKNLYDSTEWSSNGSITINDGAASITGLGASDYYIRQTFPVKGNANEDFVFSVRVRKDRLILNGEFYAKLFFLSSGNEVCVRQLDFDPDVSTWQHIITTVSSTAAFDSVKLELHITNEFGVAYFDDLFLYKGCNYGYNYNYNNNRQVTSIADGIGNSELLSYTGVDVTNVLQKSHDVTVGNVNYTYDNHHNILTATDTVSGVTVSYTYPSVNKGLPVAATVTSSDNLTMTTTYAYTADQNYLTSVTDSSGAVTQYTYDEDLGWLTEVTDPNGNETHYTYNNSDLRSSIYAAVGNDVAQVNYSYSADRLTGISNSDISYGFTYDLFGRSDTVTNTGSTLAEYSYNSDSTVARVDLADGSYTSYTYNDRDQVTSASYNGALTASYQYDDHGALTEMYDAEADVTTSYLYDPAGRTVGIARSDGQNAAFAYDAQNRPSKTVLTDQNTVLSSQTYTYDAQNRVSGTEMETIGREISYTYDGLNRLTSATGGIGGSNTVSTAYTYETSNGSQTGRLGSVSYNTTINGVTTQLYPTLSYDYDANGNITKVYENGVEKNHYVYDSLNRLIVDDNARDNSTYVYNYDACGDLLSKDFYDYGMSSDPDYRWHTISYAYNDTKWKNGVTSYNGESIVYDANGNPTTYRGHTMTWDQNRLISTDLPGYLMTYEYNADGLRVAKQMNSGNRWTYTYSGTQLIRMETPLEGVVDYHYGADGRPFAMRYGTSLYYYILSPQGDVLGLANESGSVVVTYTYDAWGTPYSTGNSVLARANPFRYRGYVYDDDTGLYYLQSRYYDPETGRFISADSLLVAGDHINSTNMFAYCCNNPVMFVDPTGRMSNSDSAAINVTKTISSLLFFIDYAKRNGMGVDDALLENIAHYLQRIDFISGSSFSDFANYLVLSANLLYYSDLIDSAEDGYSLYEALSEIVKLSPVELFSIGDLASALSYGVVKDFFNPYLSLIDIASNLGKTLFREMGSGLFVSGGAEIAIALGAINPVLGAVAGAVWAVLGIMAWDDLTSDL